MAKVILRNSWYAPDNKLYKKSETRQGPPVEVPDELCVRATKGQKDKKGNYPYLYLPTTAEVVSEDYKLLDKTELGHREILESLDIDRAAATAENAMRKDVAFQEKLAAEAKAEAEAERAKIVEAVAIDGRTREARFQKKLAAEEAAKDTEEKD